MKTVNSQKVINRIKQLYDPKHPKILVEIVDRFIEDPFVFKFNGFLVSEGDSSDVKLKAMKVTLHSSGDWSINGKVKIPWDYSCKQIYIDILFLNHRNSQHAYKFHAIIGNNFTTDESRNISMKGNSSSLKDYWMELWAVKDWDGEATI